MIIRLNKEVQNLTREQKEVLQQLGAQVEDRAIKVTATAYIDEYATMEDMMPETTGWTFYSNLDRYILHPDEKHIDDFKELDKAGKTIVRINAYIHGGIALSLGDGYPFNDSWDGGCAGFAVFDGKATEDNKKDLIWYIDFYNEYQGGGVYCVDIVDEFGETLDNACGLFRDDVVEFAKENGIPEDKINWD